MISSVKEKEKVTVLSLHPLGNGPFQTAEPGLFAAASLRPRF